MKNIGVMTCLIALFLICSVSALYVSDNNDAKFGHVITVRSVEMAELSPGEIGLLNITLKNNGDKGVSDIEIRLRLPQEFEFYSDVSKIKISDLDSGLEKKISYRIVALPNAKEGIYKANLTVDYISNYGVNFINVGQAQQDIFDFGIVIKSEPSIFAIIEDSDIYSGNGAGDVSIKFINNGTTDIKFLTVNLKESKDYQIINDLVNYVGDLDSDDYQSVSYTLKLNSEASEILLPIEVNYKDSLNRAYTKDFYLKLKIRSKAEVGKTNNNMYIGLIVGIIILIIIIVYVVLRSSRRRKQR
jgi:uncharacterized membrane protein